MQDINQISIEHIEHLSDIQLTMLLHRLLKIEAKKENWQHAEISVPFNINSPDGGADGKVVCDLATPSERLPNNLIMFQNKATDLFPDDCYDEILLPAKKDEEKRKLKPQVKELVDKNGCYILFTSRAIADNGKNKRIQKFRKAIKDSGNDNWESIDIYVYDANYIKDWVNENIESVVLVQGFNGITRPIGFITWEELGKDLNVSATIYQRNQTTEQNIISIRAALQKEKALRISGHSGLGKTRLVYEAINEQKGSFSHSAGVVYFDAGLSVDYSEINSFILSHRHNLSGTIIIDNCDADNHIKLSKSVKHQGDLKIVTLGLDDSRSIEDPKVILDRNLQRDVVAAIIEEKLGQTHDISDREYVKNLSEGYPWMAVKFCSGILLNGMSNLSQYPLDEFIQKLLFSTSEGQEEYSVICACSVFSAFGFVDDSLYGLINKELITSLQAQMDFIRTAIYDGQITDSRFREICVKYKNLDIIEKRGTLYIVKPTVLAIHLASRWLVKTGHQTIKGVIEKLKDYKLEERFVERLTDLDQIDKAKDIVNELWGRNGFFGSAEVLETSWGSLLFRYVVEVNPSATLGSLERLLQNRSIEELKSLTEPRRNFVWALEKLVFRRETFHKSAKLLYRLAVAENETWANNATNQFAQLYQIFLPGTEAPFNDRIDILKWGIQQSSIEYKKIAIRASSVGLTYEHFARSGGAESQGSGAPLKDYIPKSWEEISNYWDELFSLIIPFAFNDNPLSESIKNVIVNSIPSMARQGIIKPAILAIQKVYDQNKAFWPGALEALHSIVTKKHHLSADHLNEINTLIELLTPSDLKSKLFLTVSQPPSPHFSHDDFRGEKQAQKAKDLAQQIVESNISIEPYLSSLVKGEQRQVYHFSVRLGELSGESHPFVDKILEALAEAPTSEQNPEILFGYTSGINKKEFTISVFNKLLQSPKTAKHAFYFARVMQLDFHEIQKLFHSIEAYSLPISLFSIYQYGRATDSFSPSEMALLTNKLKDYGIRGRWVAVSLLFMYCLDNPERLSESKDHLISLIGEENMGIVSESIPTMEEYHWADLVSKILTNFDQVEFARTVTKQLIEIYSTPNNSLHFDHFTVEVFRILFDKYFDYIWDDLGNAIMSKDLMFLLHIKRMIGTRNGYNSSQGVLFENSQRYEKMLEWCAKYINIAPRRMANMMPLAIIESGKYTWHPFSRKLIDRFGNNPSVLSDLSANIGTYSTVGSSMDYYESLRVILSELLNHSFLEVRDWAAAELEYTEKKIKLEQLDNEEQELG